MLQQAEITGVKELSPGIYDNISDHDYHALSYISKTGLDYINKSPQHYLAWKCEPQEPTSAMIFGTSVHLSVFQRPEFRKRVACAPEGLDRRTKIGKAEWAKFQEENKGKIIIEQDELECIERITEEVYSHSLCSSLLGGGKAEQSLIWDQALNGDENIRMKGRVDYLKNNIIIDLKTTDDASPRGFKKSVANFRYYLQSAVYSSAVKKLTGSELENIIFIAVEKKEPYAIGVYTLDDFFVDFGKVEFERNLKTYVECLKTNKWPGYSQEIVTLSAPKWLGADSE